ncbi:MAG: class I SAM-dependent methyltransferase [Candidatus Omnitrophica bacterium]|nr:class I SAM-dependent methyltransferase [Candidatus Omnitrophota bacterium]
MIEERIAHEIAHGTLLREAWPGKLWYWETPAGRLRWKRRLKMLTSHITSDMNVLEIGCGVGYFTKEIAKTNAHVTAIDISPDLLQVAQKDIKAANVTFKIENAYDLNLSDNTFDTVVGSSVLRHLDARQALKEFNRVLKPGGSVFFTEPNMANPQILLQKIFLFLKDRLKIPPMKQLF